MATTAARHGYGYRYAAPRSAVAARLTVTTVSTNNTKPKGTNSRPQSFIAPHSVAT